jgi:hypothetical protein
MVHVFSIACSNAGRSERTKEGQCWNWTSSIRPRRTIACAKAAEPGFITRENLAGERCLDLDDAKLTLQCNHRASTGQGTGRPPVDALVEPASGRGYTLRDGTSELARLRNVVR